MYEKTTTAYHQQHDDRIMIKWHLISTTSYYDRDVDTLHRKPTYTDWIPFFRCQGNSSSVPKSGLYRWRGWSSPAGRVNDWVKWWHDAEWEDQKEALWLTSMVTKTGVLMIHHRASLMMSQHLYHTPYWINNTSDYQPECFDHRKKQASVNWSTSSWIYRAGWNFEFTEHILSTFVYIKHLKILNSPWIIQISLRDHPSCDEDSWSPCKHETQTELDASDWDMKITCRLQRDTLTSFSLCTVLMLWMILLLNDITFWACLSFLTDLISSLCQYWHILGI